MVTCQVYVLLILRSPAHTNSSSLVWYFAINLLAATQLLHLSTQKHINVVKYVHNIYIYAIYVYFYFQQSIELMSLKHSFPSIFKYRQISVLFLFLFFLAIHVATRKYLKRILTFSFNFYSHF